MVTVGGGVAVLAVGGWFSWHAHDLDHRIETTCMTTCDGAAIAGLDSDMHSAQRDAVIAYVVGGVAVASGVALYVWGHRGDGDAGSVAIVPTSSGAAVVGAW